MLGRAKTRQDGPGGFICVFVFVDRADGQGAAQLTVVAWRGPAGAGGRWRSLLRVLDSGGAGGGGRVAWQECYIQSTIKCLCYALQLID